MGALCSHIQRHSGPDDMSQGGRSRKAMVLSRGNHGDSVQDKAKQNASWHKCTVAQVIDGLWRISKLPHGTQACQLVTC